MALARSVRDAEVQSMVACPADAGRGAANPKTVATIATRELIQTVLEHRCMAGLQTRDGAYPAHDGACRTHTHEPAANVTLPSDGRAPTLGVPGGNRAPPHEVRRCRATEREDTPSGHASQGVC